MTDQYYAVLRGQDIRRIIREKQREAFRKSSRSINHKFVRTMSQSRRRARKHSRYNRRVKDARVT